MTNNHDQRTQIMYDPYGEAAAQISRVCDVDETIIWCEESVKKGTAKEKGHSTFAVIGAMLLVAAVVFAIQMKMACGGGSFDFFNLIPTLPFTVPLYILIGLTTVLALITVKNSNYYGLTNKRIIQINGKNVSFTQLQMIKNRPPFIYESERNVGRIVFYADDIFVNGYGAEGNYEPELGKDFQMGGISDPEAVADAVLRARADLLAEIERKREERMSARAQRAQEEISQW